MTALATRPDTDVALLENGNGGLPDLNCAASVIEALVENANEEALHEFRNQAEAHRLFQERSENLEQANHFARLKLLAEAGIGALSVAREPRFNSKESANGFKSWRILAMAHERGALMGVCDEIADSQRSITTTRAARILERRGWTRVNGPALQKAIDKCAADRGLSKYQLARELGLFPTNLYQPGRAPGWQWPRARQLSDLLGFDALALPPQPPKNVRRRSQPYWLAHKRKRTGGKWDKAYGHFRQLVDEFQELAPNNAPKWDEAYAHLYAIEQIIGRQMLKERQSQ